jgi:DNA repair protein SbcD/Mre11
VRDATREAFNRTVEMAIEERVDALLIAGDLYDREQTSMKTARFIASAYRRLTDAGVRVFVIRGNHDSLSRIMRELTLPEGVTVFGSKPGIEMIQRPGGMPIAVHGLSFRDEVAPESLLPKYKAPVAGAVNIGLMHTSLGGSEGHDPYAPVSLAELRSSGFHYWALGHIHRRSVDVGPAGVNQPMVVMPGMPQGRDMGEAGPKSVTLVTIGADGNLTQEERETSSAVFQALSIDLTGEIDWSRLARQIAGAAAGKARSGVETILRLGLVGSTPLAWRLRRDLDALQAEVELELGEASGIWIERMTTSCRTETAPDVRGPLDELELLITQDVLPSDGFGHGAGELADVLLRQLPPDVRDRWFGATADAQAAALRRLAGEGAMEILSRLRADGEA